MTVGDIYRALAERMNAGEPGILDVEVIPTGELRMLRIQCLITDHGDKALIENFDFQLLEKVTKQ